jgi:osmotically-inducible protein OsmY
MPGDWDLALKVRDRLTATRRDFGNITVLVDHGDVKLRGPVSSYHLRQVAVDTAKSVQGVKHVADEMRVADE